MGASTDPADKIIKGFDLKLEQIKFSLQGERRSSTRTKTLKFVLVEQVFFSSYFSKLRLSSFSNKELFLFLSSFHSIFSFYDLFYSLDLRFKHLFNFTPSG